MMTIPKMIYKLSKLGWKIFRPTTVGVRIMLYRDNTILLVKHTYHEYWYLPGGRMKKGETFEQAIKREMNEELGCQIFSMELFGVYNSFNEYKNDNIIIFYSESFLISGHPNMEIEKYDFLYCNEIPTRTSAGTKKRIEELTKGNSPYYGIW